MENQNNRNKGRHEIVTLILETKEFKIDKQKLIDRSRYFAALLRYAECGQQDHVINYEIPVFSFEEFIYWICNNRMPNFEADKTDDTLEHLLTLLELSVLFAVDDLVKDITDVLETDYLLPKHVIDIWLLAQELSINVLRDVCLAVCLDRFNELPISSICQLSKKNFLKLVGNINVRTTESYLFDVAYEWMKYHKDIVQEDLLRNKQPKILNSIISCESLDINSTVYLHCWDGKKFFELTTFEYPRDVTNHNDNKDVLTGMQITARGYYLYLSGGEFGIGSGKFNKKVWRYSLISKKWFFQTNLPNGRRHMVTTFICNKLFLVGGVGRYRRKLKSVDIYNIHTDIWTKGTDIPMDFTNVPEYYVFNGKLAIYTHISYICLYHPDADFWQTIRVFPLINKILDSVIMTPILVLKTAPCYIDIAQSGDMFLRSITEMCDIEQCNKEKCKKINYADCIRYEEGLEPFMKLLFTTMEYYMYNSDCNDSPEDIVVVCLKFEHSGNLHLHNIPIQDPNKFNSLLYSHSSTRFFNIIDPADLHTQSATLDYLI